jgi:predicted hydrocarbon binding protein
MKNQLMHPQPQNTTPKKTELLGKTLNNNLINPSIQLHNPTMKCPVCENPIQKSWKHCPECGIKMGESTFDSRDYRIDRLRALWTKKGDDSFNNNFKSIEGLGGHFKGKIKPLRPKLGDFIGIHFANMKAISIEYLQLRYVEELRDITVLYGYYGVEIGLKATKLTKITDLLSKAGNFWRILNNKELQAGFCTGFKNTHQGIPEIQKVDEKCNEFTITIDEGQQDDLDVYNIPNYIESYNILGMLEGICDMKCSCKETHKNGRKYFTYKFHPNTNKIEYPPLIKNNEDYARALDALIDNIIENKPSSRKILNDEIHISGDQCDNYFTLKISEGHKILTKYAGVVCGKKLAERAKVEGVENAFDFAKNIFLQEKVCILHEPKQNDNQFILKIDESVFSSGVQNIHMKQCTFLAGVIEGIITQSTNQQWNAEETKCKANGDEHCEITIKNRK